MDQLLSIGAMTPDAVLQQAMYDAYDVVVEKKGRLDNLIAARSDLEGQLAQKRQLAEVARQAYVSGVATSASADGSVSEAAKTARAQGVALGGEVAALDEMIKELSEPIKLAENDLRTAHDAYLKCRNRLIAKMAIKPPNFNRGIPIATVPAAGFDLRGAMIAYMAHFDNAVLEQGAPFDTRAGVPQRFFSFLMTFFANPSREELAMLRAEISAIAWGDRPQPPAIAIPKA